MRAQCVASLPHLHPLISDFSAATIAEFLTTLAVGGEAIDFPEPAHQTTDAAILRPPSLAVHRSYHVIHSVLPYANWEWGRGVQSESLLSIRSELQSALARLGLGIPESAYAPPTPAPIDDG